MSNEEEIKCPKCGSNNIGIESNSPTSFSDSMLGKFDYPLFYNYCFACGHRWYLSSKASANDDKNK